jgi:hypothetical protein
LLSCSCSDCLAVVAAARNQRQHYNSAFSCITAVKVHLSVNKY